MLNTRIKKIETGFSENNLRFCSCHNDLRLRRVEAIYNFALHGTPYDAAAFDEMELQLPETFCDRCQKPVDVELIADYARKLAVTLPSYENYEFPQPVNVGPTSAGGAAQLTQEVNEIPVGMISRSEVAARLKIELHDVARHIRSGRLETDGSKRFVSQNSVDALKALIGQRDSDM